MEDEIMYLEQMIKYAKGRIGQLQTHIREKEMCDIILPLLYGNITYNSPNNSFCVDGVSWIFPTLADYDKETDKMSIFIYRRVGNERPAFRITNEAFISIDGFIPSTELKNFANYMFKRYYKCQKQVFDGPTINRITNPLY